MTAWWYAENGQKNGPVEPEELGQLFQAGKIGLQTLLWHEHMEDWRALADIDELKELKATVPPPLLQKGKPDPLSLPLATRWPRFFARIFDVWWETLLVAVVLGAILGRYSVSFVEWLSGPGAGNWFGILCIPIALLLDALIYRVVGNTPGKALVGLTVGTLGGRPLSLGQYLERNFSMWARGFAFGLPLINLFTMAHQSGRLGKGLQASYDESTGFRVRAKASGLVRKLTFGTAFVSLFVVMAVLNGIEQQDQREAVLTAAQKSYSWENPHTRLSAIIDSRWKQAAQPNADGQEIYTFSERADRAVVVFAVEQAPGFSMDAYVRAFHAHAATDMDFSDAGRFFERDKHLIWQGSGQMQGMASNRLNVQIVQIGSAFWRVVTIQTMPYEYSEQLVENLHTSLWNTVRLEGKSI